MPDRSPTSSTRTQVSLIDMKRAYFNAAIVPREPHTYVELLSEDPDHGNQCGPLLRHMYGTRKAVDGWQEECSCTLVKHGFKQGTACPNLFYHPAKRIHT